MQETNKQLLRKIDLFVLGVFFASSAFLLIFYSTEVFADGDGSRHHGMFFGNNGQNANRFEVTSNNDNNNFQAYRVDWDVQHQGFRGNARTRGDICFSEDTQMWNSGDTCYQLTVLSGDRNLSQRGTSLIARNEFLDYNFVVKHLQTRRANSWMYTNTYGRRVFIHRFRLTNRNPQLGDSMYISARTTDSWDSVRFNWGGSGIQNGNRDFGGTEINTGGYYIGQVRGTGQINSTIVARGPGSNSGLTERTENDSVSVRDPDLVVSSGPNISGNLTEGSRLTLSAVMRNSGSGRSYWGNRYEFYVDGSRVGSGGVGNLERGNTASMSANWTATRGNHTVRVCVDTRNNVPESDELNNCSGNVAFRVLQRPTVSLTADSTNIAYNTATTLRMRVSGDADYCDTSWAGRVGFSNRNDSTGNLTSNRSYSVTCQGPAGSDSSSVTIRVNPPPPLSVTISADSGNSNIPYNTATTIRWNSSNATSCSDPFGGSSKSGKRSTGNLTSSRTYTITCNGEAGQRDSKNVRVNVEAGQSDLVITGGPDWSPGSITEGDRVRFSGSTRNDGVVRTDSTFAMGYILDGRLFDTEGSDRLDPGEGRTKTSDQWTATEGNHTIQVCTDYHNEVRNELNERNNCSGTRSFNVASSVAPSVTLTANPTTVDYGGSTTLTWRVTPNSGVDSCTASGDWKGGKNRNGSSEVQRNLTSNKTYRIQCLGPGGNSNLATATVTVNPARGNIHVRATLNGSPYNSTVSYRLLGRSTISGTSTPGNHNNQPAASWQLQYRSGGPGGATMSSITPASTQTLTNNATITFTMNFTSNPPSAPTSLSANNATCEQISLSWSDNSSNEDGFRVYRGASLGSLSEITTVGANTTSYTDTTVSGGSTYYYGVTSYNAGGESARATAGPVFVNSCAPNLALSTMVVDRVNGSNYTGQTIQNGDTLTLRVVISNTGTASAFDVYVDSTLTSNLVFAGNARLNGSSISTSGSGQNITLNATQNLGDKSAGGSNWIVLFDAIVTSSASQSVDFFKVDGVIRYSLTNGGSQNQSRSVSTGLIPLRTGKAQVPTIREVAP